MHEFELDAVRDLPDSGPVTMLNLVKLRRKSLDGTGNGRKAYLRYAKTAQELVEARGGRVVWAGMIEGVALDQHGDTDWDWALLVDSPSRAAFIDMVTSPAYREANVHRENGAERHVILASRTVLSEPFPEAAGP